ncbi:MAG TPA: galactose-1-phosphate uridylyltransferase [Dehalococcoidia bacterium]|nr:galactose-1-phosphate uridylyltransferase [Dehalococcoidia bacterium]
MRKLRIERPDGRRLWYYAFDERVPEVLDLAQPGRSDDALELRWNALLGEQVIISTGRQDRTFLPPPEACPLCPTLPSAAETTEIPSVRYEIVAFENRFPSLRTDAKQPDRGDAALFAKGAASGSAEVLVYSPQHAATLATLPPEQTRRLVRVWSDRYAELDARPEVAYVFIFENRGREIGVTLTHPHGQIYALPFVPPRPAREYEQAAAYARAHGGACLLCDLVAAEVSDDSRIIAAAGGFVAYVPFAARLPYEVHVAPAAHRPSLIEFNDAERDALADVVRTVQAKYDALWGFPMPYTMSIHQRASDGIARPGDHLHVEFAPPYRNRDKLKYLAGIETGAGTFVNDVAPEAAAADLRVAGAS